jgi:hypothetical protein
MSGSATLPGHRDGLLDEAIEVLQDVERGLATVQRDEVVVERVGAIVLLAGAVALGGAVAIGVALVLIRRRRSQPAPSEAGEHPDAEEVHAPVVADGAPASPEVPRYEDRRA